MSFLATFSISEHKYNVISASFDVSQPLGHRNMPKGGTQLGIIHVVLESNNKLELFDWGLYHKQAKGEIVFFRKDTNAALKTLEFENAYCVHYEELFEADSPIPMKVNLRISAHSITFYGVSAQEKWSGIEEEAKNTVRHKEPQNAKNSDSGEVISFNPD